MSDPAFDYGRETNLPPGTLLGDIDDHFGSDPDRDEDDADTDENEMNEDEE